MTVLLALTVAASAAPDKDKDRPVQDREKKTFTFGNTVTKKSLLRQRDSLLQANRELQLRLDSMYMVNESLLLAEEEQTGDSINPGFMEMTGLDQFASDTAHTVSRDSLLSLWYQKRNLNLMDLEPSDIDTIEMTSDIPDSVYIERLQRLNSFISVPYNRIIRNHIIYYTQRMPDKMERILGLATYYIPIFEEIFDKYDMPLELTAMAVIESALNTKAVSRARAKGMWQFMYSTARRYGLTINSYVDERFDPIASADAAARYLRDSYLIFGDWNLAIASYNCGAGNVNKAIRRSGGSKDFWEIYPYLPRETRGYVPSFFAALYAMKYYKEHNLTPDYIPMPPHTDTLKINRMLHFEQIAHYTGASIEELRTHNPQYLHDIIPGTEHEYILQLPYQYTNSFIDHEDEIYAWKDSVYFSPAAMKKIEQGVSADATRIVHRVKSGETLSHIALRYGVSVRNIQRWNGIGTRIRVGQRLAIYLNGSGPAASSASRSSSSSGSKPATTVSDGYIIYTVRSGDNLWDISRVSCSRTPSSSLSGASKRLRAEHLRLRLNHLTGLYVTVAYRPAPFP